MTNAPHPWCSCGNEGFCTASGAVLLVIVSYRQKIEKGAHAKKEFKREKEQNEAEHRESTIDGMQVLVIPLGSVDSVLYPILGPDYNVRFSLLFHSAPAIPDTCYM